MGRMGSAMAVRLSETGHEVVVHNRSEGRAAEIASAIGAEIATSPAAAVAAVEVVITCLADDVAVRQTYLSDNGVVAGSGAATIVVDMSTIDPVTVAEVAGPVRATGADLLDAPVSGSVALVESGSLTVMVGGESDVLERAVPVLDHLAKTIFHMGPSGSGATMKLAVNSLVHATNAALAEALVLAEKAGVDRSLAYDVLAAGAAGSPFVQYKRASFLDPEAAPVAFALDLVAKDLRLIRGLAARVGAPMPAAGVGADLVDRAIGSGLGDRDMSVLAEYLRSSTEAAP
jgi:3-hydroxyisobutyrate dehydrogenase/2-hydroxy-3-oxopropionate reductase